MLLTVVYYYCDVGVGDSTASLFLKNVTPAIIFISLTWCAIIFNSLPGGYADEDLRCIMDPRAGSVLDGLFQQPRQAT